MDKHRHVYHLKVEKNLLNLGDLDSILKITGGHRMLVNDLLAPYLLKEWIDCDQTCKDIAFNLAVLTYFQDHTWIPAISRASGWNSFHACKGISIRKTKPWFGLGDLGPVFNVTRELSLKYVLN